MGGAIWARVVTSGSTELHTWRRIGPYPAPHGSRQLDVEIPNEFFSTVLLKETTEQTASPPDNALLQLGFEVGGGGGHSLHITDAFLYVDKLTTVLTASFSPPGVILTALNGEQFAEVCDIKADDSEESQ